MHVTAKFETSLISSVIDVGAEWLDDYYTMEIIYNVIPRSTQLDKIKGSL